MSVVVVSQLVFVRAAKAPSRPATLARRAPRSKPTAARSVSGEMYCKFTSNRLLVVQIVFFARLGNDAPKCNDLCLKGCGL